MKNSEGVTITIIIIIIIKRTCRIEDFAVPAHHRVNLKESGKRDKFLNLARELKKTMERESDGDTNCN